MKQKGYVNIAIIIGIIILIGVTGYFVKSQPNIFPALTPSPNPLYNENSPSLTSPIPVSDKTKCANYTILNLNEDQGFVDIYYSGNLREIPVEKFTGILIENKVRPVSIVQRDLPYKLNGKEVMVKNVDLSKYVGKRVVMTGKNYHFPLEGTQRDEIWPVSIVCK